MDRIEDERPDEGDIDVPGGHCDGRLATGFLPLGGSLSSYQKGVEDGHELHQKCGQQGHGAVRLAVLVVGRLVRFVAEREEEGRMLADFAVPVAADELLAEAHLLDVLRVDIELPLALAQDPGQDRPGVYADAHIHGRVGFLLDVPVRMEWKRSATDLLGGLLLDEHLHLEALLRLEKRSTLFGLGQEVAQQPDEGGGDEQQDEELLDGEQPRQVRRDFPDDAAEPASSAEAQHDRQHDVDGEEDAGDNCRGTFNSFRALYFSSSTSFSWPPSFATAGASPSKPFLRKISSMFCIERAFRFGLRTRRSSSSNSLSSVSVSPNCRLSMLSASPSPPAS
uniref:Uncharacterized protein n=1 Tax=Anopheles atroparvus TaxID=41427 RepID=A0A182JGY7_ANOAO